MNNIIELQQTEINSIAGGKFSGRSFAKYAVPAIIVASTAAGFVVANKGNFDTPSPKKLPSELLDQLFDNEHNTRLLEKLIKEFSNNGYTIPSPFTS